MHCMHPETPRFQGTVAAHAQVHLKRNRMSGLSLNDALCFFCVFRRRCSTAAEAAGGRRWRRRSDRRGELQRGTSTAGAGRGCRGSAAGTDAPRKVPGDKHAAGTQRCTSRGDSTGACLMEGTQNCQNRHCRCGHIGDGFRLGLNAAGAEAAARVSVS